MREFRLIVLLWCGVFAGCVYGSEYVEGAVVLTFDSTLADVEIDGASLASRPAIGTYLDYGTIKLETQRTGSVNDTVVYIRLAGIRNEFTRDFEEAAGDVVEMRVYTDGVRRTWRSTRGHFSVASFDTSRTGRTVIGFNAYLKSIDHQPVTEVLMSADFELWRRQ